MLVLVFIYSCMSEDSFKLYFFAEQLYLIAVMCVDLDFFWSVSLVTFGCVQFFTGSTGVRADE
jgi:hypothetical protein